MEVFVPKASDNRFVKYMAVAAHKDDLEMIGLEGIWRSQNIGGGAFAGIVLTDGAGCVRSGAYSGISDEDMTEIRSSEQKRAAEAGGYAAVYLFDLPSEALKSAAGELGIEKSESTCAVDGKNIKHDSCHCICDFDSYMASEGEFGADFKENYDKERESKHERCFYPDNSLKIGESESLPDEIKDNDTSDTGLSDTGAMSLSESKRLIREIAGILSKHPKLEALYLHNPFDSHPTHVAACKVAIEAVKTLPEEERPQKVYGVEVWRCLDWLPPEDRAVLDVGGSEDFAFHLMSFFKSQNEAKRYDAASEARRRANATFFDGGVKDKTSSCIFAVDLTEVAYGKKHLAEFTEEKMAAFAASVRKNLR